MGMVVYCCRSMVVYLILVYRYGGIPVYRYGGITSQGEWSHDWCPHVLLCLLYYYTPIIRHIGTYLHGLGTMCRFLTLLEIFISNLEYENYIGTEIDEYRKAYEKKMAYFNCNSLATIIIMNGIPGCVAKVPYYEYLYLV